MTADRYVLIVSGIVTFSDNDKDLRDLLLSEGDNRARLPEALQELEEEAENVKITLEKLG